MTTSVQGNKLIPAGESVAHSKGVSSGGEASRGDDVIPRDPTISGEEAAPDREAMPSGEVNSQSGNTPPSQPDHGSEQAPESLPSETLSPLSPGSSGKTAQPRPDKAFVRRRIAHFIAFGGGIGLSRVAPGTAGTLAAFPLFWVLSFFFDAAGFLLLIGALFIIGIWACAATGKALGSHDHGGMVWDEIVAFLLVLEFTPKVLIWQACAFLLFRVFDIIKPPPIGYYDSKLRGGFGVMFDDMLAAFYALLCLAAWKAFAA
jgi:phosphatidylglycerophosphatase A